MLVRPSVLVLLSLLAPVGLPLPVAARARAQLGPEGTVELTIGWRLIETARFHRQGSAVDGPFERKNTLDHMHRALDDRGRLQDYPARDLIQGWRVNDAETARPREYANNGTARSGPHG